MNLEELYKEFDGDYTQAKNVMRIEKLIDKHIRKFRQNELVNELIDAYEKRDDKKIFESSHALKGVSANLGLTKICEIASCITEEFRQGNTRKLSDEQLSELIIKLKDIYNKTIESIKKYEECQ